MIDWSRIEGFEWDEGNDTKNLIKHGVSKEEAESVLYSDPIVAEDESHSSTEQRLAAFGITPAGRLLTVVFTLRGEGTKIRVISARGGRPRGRVYTKHIYMLIPNLSPQQVKRGRVYTKHKVMMYDIGHLMVFFGGPICVLYRRDPVGRLLRPLVD